MLDELVEEAARGMAFVITQSGKPLVQVAPYETTRSSKFGFMRGQIKVPEDSTASRKMRSKSSSG